MRFISYPFVLTCALVSCNDARPAALGHTSSIRIGGSATVYPALEEAAAIFERAHPDVAIRLSHSSSGGGLAGLIAGELDLTGASRKPHASEFEAAANAGEALKMFQIGFDALVVIVHPSRHAVVDALSRSQLEDIFFTGRITEWSQLDPRLSGAIAIYGRDPVKSGTADMFSRLIPQNRDSSYVDDIEFLSSTSLMVPSVAGNIDGIAFAPLGHVDDSVRALAILDERGQPIGPSVENIRNLSYPLRRDLFIITNGMPTGALNEFVQFLLGPRGQQVVAAAGLVAVH